MEEAVAFIPNVNLVAALGLKPCWLVLTGRRMIFSVGYEGKGTQYMSTLGAIAGTIAKVMETPREMGPEIAGLEELVADARNITVEYNDVVRLALKRRVGGGYLRVDHAKPDLRISTIIAGAAPPSAYMEAGKAQGMTHRELIKEYVRWVHDCFRLALPPANYRAAIWKL